MDKQAEAMEKMEACVEDIKTWMRQNKLKLNEDKTELVIISPPKQTDKITIDSITICDTTIKASSTAKNLGAIRQHCLIEAPH